MEFIYTGIDKNSVKQKGKLKANNEREVIEYLRGSNITPLSVRRIKESEGFFIFKKIKTSDIILFTRQLSSMALTGLTLIESLKILRQQTASTGMRELINDVILQVSEGTPFSEALASHKNYFSDVYIALIVAAEKGGLLDKVLARLADNLEKSDDLKKRVQAALFYPVIVITGVIIVIAIMNLFVIPHLGDLYSSLNIELPLTTKIVLGLSNLFKTFYPLIILGVIGGFFLYKRLKKTEDGMKAIDSAKLKIPVLGQIFTLYTLDEIVRTFSLLITSGTSIIESLNIVANVSDNYWYRRAIFSTSALVEKGISLSVALANSNIFPPMLIQMVKVGESTGKIDESLLKISEYFERDLNLRVQTLTTAIEPILIIVLGVSVGFLILSIITPIYGLISQIQ